MRYEFWEDYKMAKAFTEEEKIKIKEKIMETALELFHDKGT